MLLPALRQSLLILTLSAAAAAPVLAQEALLNVSYDVSRELYKDINPAFAKHYQGKTGKTVTVSQSHGGSSRQALSVAGGLEADIVTMNQATDLDLLADKGLLRKDWRQAFPHGAAPYTSTTVFLVRKGNPKAIKDWADLARSGVSVIVPNPKTSGNGRYTYLAAWGSVISKGGSEAQAREFVSKLLANVPVLDGGGRGATTTFTQRDIGDVLVTFENEAELIENEVGKGKFDVVYPSITIEAEAPLAIVDKVVAKKGTAAAAKAYADFLFSPEAQEIIARHNFRPRDAAVAARHAQRFPKVKTFTVDSLLGGWPAVTKTHFADGGVYDQLVLANAKR
ncbi:MAG: sulfate ABC transporter substrate-binding protein [Roseateles asaccharophilus]|uniref:sulfate ABC transporter substrate-binding protein n=1 Tax=Roseateles asaccharophilus TaxID=582607 RepID=UPI003919B4EA